MAFATSDPTPKLLAAAANHCDNQNASHLHMAQECEDGAATTPTEKCKD